MSTIEGMNEDMSADYSEEHLLSKVCDDVETKSINNFANASNVGTSNTELKVGHRADSMYDSIVPCFKDQVRESNLQANSGANCTSRSIRNPVVTADIACDTDNHELINRSQLSSGLTTRSRNKPSDSNTSHVPVGAFPIRGPSSAATSDDATMEDHIELQTSRHQIAFNNADVEVEAGTVGLVNAYLVQKSPVVDAKPVNEDYFDDLEVRRKKLEVEEETLRRELRNRRRREIMWSIALLGIVAVIIVSVYFFLISNSENDETTIATTNPFRPFNSTADLYEAVDSYLYKTNPETSLEAKIYGYPIGTWDVSRIKNFDRLFDANGRSSVFNFQNINISSHFNEDISSWNVSSATSMFGMFASAVNFNQDISKWDTSRVSNMSCIFTQASAFNHDVSKWDVSNVKNMSYMFYNASNFSGDVSMWKTHKVLNMQFMFAWCTALGMMTRYNGAWNTSSVTTMKGMFRHAEFWDSPDLNNWDVSNVQDMSLMFSMTSRFNGSDISGWNVRNVKTMSGMFHNASAFNQNISPWNVSFLVKVDNMFNDAALFQQNLCPWSDTISATFASTEQEENNVFPVSFNGTDMFTNSACANQSDPTGSSWCQSCMS